MAETLDSFSECHDCGLLQRVPALPDGGAAICARCSARLGQHWRHAIALCCAASAAGLALFAVAFVTPLASVTLQGGRFSISTLSTGPERLRQLGAWELSVAVVLTLLVAPVAKLAITLAMGLASWLGHVPTWLRRSFALLPRLSHWAMVEVFLLGAMIALVRLGAWVTVSFGPALFALGGIALCSLGIDAALDRTAFWSRVPFRADAGQLGEPRDYLGCLGCGLVVRSRSGLRCPRCTLKLRARKAASTSRTWALVIAGAVLAIPANVLPVMTITKLGRGGPSTILGGTVELTQRGFTGLAVVVFVASILVPFAKLVTLSVLLVMTSRGSAAGLRLRTSAFRVVARIGRWSMLDIFATMTLVALARFGWLGNVLPDQGAVAFCAVVWLTLLASESFDPRLMWDAASKNQPEASMPTRAASMSAPLESNLRWVRQ